MTEREAPGVGLSEEEQSWHEEAVECVAGDFAMSNGPESERRTLVLLNRLDAERARVAEVEQRADKAESDLADLRTGVANEANQIEAVGRGVGNDLVGRSWVAGRLRALISERQGGEQAALERDVARTATDRAIAAEARLREVRALADRWRWYHDACVTGESNSAGVPLSAPKLYWVVAAEEVERVLGGETARISDEQVVERVMKVIDSLEGEGDG